MQLKNKVLNHHYHLRATFKEFRNNTPEITYLSMSLLLCVVYERDKQIRQILVHEYGSVYTYV